MSIYSSITTPLLNKQFKTLEGLNIDQVMNSIKTEIEERLPIEFDLADPPSTFLVIESQQVFVVGSSTGNISLYHLSSGEIIREIEKATEPIISLLVVQEKKKIAASTQSGNILILSFPDLIFEHSIPLEENNPKLALFDKYLIALGESKDVHCFSLDAYDESSSKKLVWRGRATALFVKGEEIFIGFEEGHVYVYDSLEFKHKKMFDSEMNAEITQIAVNEEFIALAFSNFLVKVYDLDFKGENLIDSHESSITALDFLVGSTFLVTSSQDSKIMLWNLKKRRSFLVLNYENSPVTQIQCSHEGVIYSSQKNNTFLKWTLPTLSKDVRLKEHEGTITDMEFSKYKPYIVTISTTGELFVWNYIKETVYKKLMFPCKLNRVQISKCEEFLLVSSDEPALYKINTEDFKIELLFDQCIVNTIKFHDNEQMVVTGDALNRIIVWTLPEFQPLVTLKGHFKMVTAISILNEREKILSGSKDKTLRIWDIRTGNEVSKLLGHNDAITSLRASNEDTLGISGSKDCKIILWDLVKSLILYEITLEYPPLNIQFSNNMEIITIASYDKIIFWDMRIHSIVLMLSTKKDMKNLSLTSDQSVIGIAEGKTLYLRTNPMGPNVNFDIVGEFSGKEYIFMKYVYDILSDNTEVRHEEDYNHWLIVPHEVNILHILVYKNLYESLKKALNSEKIPARLNYSSLNESPLSLAIKKEYPHCINEILTSMNERSLKNPKIIAPLTYCLKDLNKIDFPYLPVVYQNLMRKNNSWYLPVLCPKNISLPITHFSKHMVIISESFFEVEDGVETTQVTFSASVIPENNVIGSKDSIEFLNSIYDAPEENILKSDFVKVLLEYKWKKVKSMIFIEALFYLLYLVILVMLVEYNEKWILISGFVLSMIFTVYEFFEFAVERASYWKSKWNYIDIFRCLSFKLAFGYGCIESMNDELYHHLLVFAIIISFIRGISFFRIFSFSRYMVNLLIRVLLDMRGFTVILIYCLLAFGVIFKELPANRREGISLVDSFLGSYMMMIGEFETDNFEVFEWVIFVLATWLTTILMLNLLISIISDIYSIVESQSEVADRKELLGMIIEMENLIFWKRKVKSRSYMQVCDVADFRTPEENLEKVVREVVSEELENFKKEIREILTGNKEN